ncbi:MAG: hypothetical protein LBH45_04025 [Campylobacteraceae bacterium]|nr:hypothetical protein [Campylobacteraceae bacterium]
MAKFFSSSEDTKKIFKKQFDKSDFCVIGIGSKCQEACEYALLSQSRIDTLQLFLPKNIGEIKMLKSKGINIEIYIFANTQDCSEIMLEEFKKYAFVYTIKSPSKI